MKKIKILCVRFQNELRPDEIELFRGAVLSKLQEVSSVLFHNHVGDRFRYSYPLIQYKRLGRQAAIVCLEEGTEAIGELFSANDFCFRIGQRMVEMKISSIKARQVIVQLWDNLFTYRLARWLPFNEENYRAYREMDGLADRYAFLEQKLTGNLLSFAKGMGIYFEDRVICKILETEDPYWITYKGVRMMAFNIRFKSNLSLPDGIGLGKGVSLGNGLLWTYSYGKD
ncbi:CRISPR-associated endonuclease Cas6 [uncultured Parabacteroides sp.]|uniref:CRISPR-associated endonuclease Cas6 n=1 Tax=uncultured Parabacteroides sp. TaxID=512312 RepID=UPI0025CFF367|nr:CRISPR-associated endonuclease Cas6 [uncultured Parabacteroides sp.]